VPRLFNEVKALVKQAKGANPGRPSE
jgi:hypothetical protein